MLFPSSTITSSKCPGTESVGMGAEGQMNSYFQGKGLLDVMLSRQALRKTKSIQNFSYIIGKR